MNTGSRGRVAAALLVAAVLLVGAVVVALSGVGMTHAIASQNDRQDVLGIARQDAVDFTTYDYRNLKADFDRFAVRATGNLRTQYTTLTPDLIARFTSLKVQSQGQVVSAGVVSQSSDTATVIVAVNDTIHNAKNPKGQIVYDRLAFQLQRVGNDWLATNVQPL